MTDFASADQLTDPPNGTTTLTYGAGVVHNYTGAKQAVTWKPTSASTYTVDITGTLSTNAGTGARGIDASSTAFNGAKLVVTVHNGGKILTDDDAIRDKTDFQNGSISISVEQGGAIQSTNGSGLDFDSFTVSSTGTFATVSNLGSISSTNTTAVKFSIPTQLTNGSSTNSLADITGGGKAIGGVLTKGFFQSALPAGFNAGADTATYAAKTIMTFDNWGKILGKLGSGMNIDLPTGFLASDVSSLAYGVVQIHNEAGAVLTGTSGTDGTGAAVDGDGIDIDGIVNILNDGTINAFGLAAGTTTPAGSPLPLNEAITVGGGTIVNNGTIYSIQRAITVDDSNDGDAYAATKLINNGTIQADNTSVAAGTEGAIWITDNLSDTVTNNAAGSIKGDIVFKSGAGDATAQGDTVANSGSITGKVTFGIGNDTFNAATGSSVSGVVDGGAGTDTLNLSGAGTGSVGSFVNFEALSVQGGKWTLTASDSFATGTTVASGATLATTGAGQIASGDITLKGGAFELGGSTSAGTGAIVFAAGSTSNLIVDLGAAPGNTIDGFTGTDTITLKGFDGTTTSTSYDSSTKILTVTDNSGHSTTLKFGDVGAGSVFQHASVAGGASVTLCFASGTLIRTVRGEVAVEDLRVGDVVVTASGRERPVTWVGSREVRFPNATSSFDGTPVRIRAGAFGNNLPHRPLRLSQGHPVLVKHGAEEFLVPVMCLINGTSIAKQPCAQVTYWHVELDAHDILVAEGLAAESYINLGSREWFTREEYAIRASRGAEIVPASPDDRCLPVATDGPVVEQERRRLYAVFASGLTLQCGWPAEETGAVAA